MHYYKITFLKKCFKRLKDMFSDLLLDDWIGFSLWEPNVNDEVTLLILLLLNIKFSNFYINQVSR